MLELMQSGGFLMLPILLCSIAAMAIIGERFWALQKRKICPNHLVSEVWQWEKNKQLTLDNLTELRSSSPLGRILAAGLVNLRSSREIMKESLEDAGRHVLPDLERFLNSLGTIAAVTPLLGLLGTVVGMIKVFTTITTMGVGNPAVLADGISQALLTTAAGLSVAIPSLIFYRYFQGKVENLILNMEEEALKMIDVLHGQRALD